MTTTTTTYVVCVGVADIRRDPDPNAELVTQALMNVEVTAGETEGEWTHVALTDYTGWISSMIFCRAASNVKSCRQAT